MKAFSLLLLFFAATFFLSFQSITKDNNKPAVYITSGKLIFKTEACGGNSDNKDHDTKVNVVVFGNYGYPVAYRNYSEDIEFEDNGSLNEVPLTIGDPRNPGQLVSADNVSQFVQKIQVSITPEGHDTWVFDNVQAQFNFSNGNSVAYNLNYCVLLSESRNFVMIWAGRGPVY